MNPRRWLLLRMAALPLLAPACRSARAADADAAHAADADTVQRGRELVFPRDHGAHLGTRTEWWYATGWLGESAQQPSHGMQITFFRSRTGFGTANASRFAARQLLFAHAAVLDLRSGEHVHDQRIVRWSETPGAVPGHASTTGGLVRLRDWEMAELQQPPRESRSVIDGTAAGWQTRASGRDFSFDLRLQRSQPLLLQGDGGFSRKGPEEHNASHYYSEPQLLASGRVSIKGRSARLSGRAWLDHEWSSELMHPQAVGWDWIGINLFDGSALTAFVLRRRDGSALWGGGSFRSAGGPSLSFGAGDVTWKPGRSWRSPASGATYPVHWQVDCPAGHFEVRALADAQELDSRASTGTIYWEGLSELLDARGRRVGLGYLEMTGYAAPIKV